MASPRLGRLTAVAGAFVALSLAIAAPAWADTTFQLKQSNVTAAGFDTHSCDNIPGGPVAGKDGWLFVLPDKPRVFVSLTLHFSGGHTVTVGAAGIIDDKGTSKAFALTPAGWTLLSGTAEVTGAATDKKDFFVLSHTCPASGGSTEGTPTPSPTRTASPTASATAGATGGAGGPGGGLPVTGAAVGGLLALGAGLIGAGVALLVLRRRRMRFDA